MEFSNLPEELRVMIFNKLNTTIDVVRFRSVCSLWRSLLPPPSSSITRLLHSRTTLRQSFLFQCKIYRIQPSSSNKGWIIKLFQIPNSSKLYLSDLFTNNRIPTQKKLLNLINFRVFELFQLYSMSGLEFNFEPVGYVKKVILFSVEGRCKIFALLSDWLLEVSNIGDNTKTILKGDDGKTNTFDDIILTMGQLYVVDRGGTIFWINPLSLKLVQFYPKLSCSYQREHMTEKLKKLVEYDGNLYVVYLYIDHERYNTELYIIKEVFVDVYKMDVERGKWLVVKDLGDGLFVLSEDSNFSLLAKDYYGCQGNCIYFYSRDRAYCFSLESLEAKLVDNIFWPCPTLFHHMTS